MIGEFVIVRGESSGAFCGILKAVSGRCVELEGSRNLWRWRGANTLREVALRGADQKSYTRISEPVSRQLVLDAVEILLCTPEAAENLRVSRWLD